MKNKPLKLILVLCATVQLSFSSLVMAQTPNLPAAPLENKKNAPPELTQEQINSRIFGNSSDGEKNKSSNKKPDLAYGAFQRGYYLTAFKYALPLAKLGDPAAQTLIGELYDKGLGIKLDKKEATLWYKFAAQNGSREAQFSYALKLLEGKYVTQDKKAARELLKSSADAGHSVAQFNYAQIIVDERPTSRGFEIALGYYEKAANSGVADAYFAMAQIYARGIGAKGPDEVKARELLVKAARNGVDNAQIELAIWLANGRGGDKDLKGALAWFKIAATRGNVIAQNRLARMLALGMGTKVQPAEAAKWYVLARRRGLKDSMLDDFFTSLEPGIRKQALDAANRWPAG
ncbi:MAG: sel1 repeat family protein [Rhizobiaceae bacterium]|nr:sel1 repeat family protein [Rhizobiaceae bacterium]